MTKIYMSKKTNQIQSFMGTHCLNASSTPCWIPQAKHVIDSEVQDSLLMCPTFWDYNCELIVLYHGIQMAESKCAVPCRTTQYRLSRQAEQKMSPTAWADSQISFRFSNNFIMKYTEVQVVTKILHICLGLK